MKAQMQIPMKPAAPAPPLFTPAPFGTLQRKCACGGSGGSGSGSGQPGGECPECKKKKMTLQRLSRGTGSLPRFIGVPPVFSHGQDGHATVPPVVQEVLQSPGQSLDTKTRAFFPPRISHDFSRIRIHAEGKAAESANLQTRAAKCFPADARLPVLSDAPKEIEAGHTDCDWDRNVKGDEPFIPKSGNAKVKIITDDPCTQQCTVQHEAKHVSQVKPICQTYFDCYTQAPAKAATSDLCKGMAGADLKKCQDLVTQMLRAECFIAAENAWDAQKWECEGYKVSLSCAEGLLAKATPACRAKIEQYRDSAKQQIRKYCKAAK